MVARYTGACLGLLAFGLTVFVGLAVNNPVTVTLSRAIWALAVFCALGLVLGGIAQMVIHEHARRRHEEVLGRPSESAPDPADSAPEDALPVAEAEIPVVGSLREGEAPAA
ncbi:MAG: hypothetical protein IID40_10880 [Planctomycetes bacterium]|nr:hypothetical protein [Planctomycetota bacterium]